jgi:hypothetical protein
MVLTKKDILHFRDNLIFFTLQNGKLRAECAAEVHPDLKLPTSDSPLWFKRLVPWFRTGPSSFWSQIPIMDSGVNDRHQF